MVQIFWRAGVEVWGLG
uniref:Uncharacterized protein n=1 Tax=Rhizophora mucronata TaxID=61149 RepID=A0A2P2QZS3_RHIMU